MNARGATVPLSAGFLLMWRYNERSADSSVGGDGGMRKIGEVPFGGLGLEPNACCRGEDSCGDSVVEYLRSVFRRTFAGGAGCCIIGKGSETAGGEREATSGTVGSGYWTSNSRKGPQKYRACNTEFA